LCTYWRLQRGIVAAAGYQHAADDSSETAGDRPQAVRTVTDLPLDLLGRVLAVGKNPLAQLLGLVVGLGALATRAVFGLEKQIIELRREIRSRGDG
jgi:hypothetical protein